MADVPAPNVFMEAKMDSPAKENDEVPERGGNLVECPLADSPGSGDSRMELACIEKLLAADWKGRRGEPASAGELLEIGEMAFEPLFLEPPVGPVPEYLMPHLWVHGCVAEYEEKFEELDRWKAMELHRWLKNRVGGKWRIGGKVFELQAQMDNADAGGKFWFRAVEDNTGCAHHGR